ncbi:MAG: ribose-5-phosphate isomerase RpiA [Candidatus Latescibacter sp.]|nr:ribose-5-phosphate isomerase RpiA [Candidatus Latescibacter sp.]
MDEERDREKKQASERAVDFIKTGMIVGLGHGSTVHYAILRISHLLREGKLENILYVPCSDNVGETALRLGIPLTTLDEHPALDVTIDGADEVDPGLNLIKGRGGALLREKIAAQASLREIIVVDSSKLSPVLGTNSPIPVEVVPYGWRSQAAFLESIGGHPEILYTGNGIQFRTDQGNMILNCRFGPIVHPQRLAERLNSRAGIAGHGLFLGLATDVIVGAGQEIKHLRSAATTSKADA